jgi:hypothetical protein
LGTRVKRRECTTAKECKWEMGAWQSWRALVSFHVQSSCFCTKSSIWIADNC